MPKILVLYYSMYGHVKTLAQSVDEGAKSIAGTEVVIKRVPELMPSDVFKKAGGKEDNTKHASPQELAGYDAIILVLLQDLVTCLRRCVISLIKQEDYGLKER